MVIYKTVFHDLHSQVFFILFVKNNINTLSCPHVCVKFRAGRSFEGGSPALLSSICVSLLPVLSNEDSVLPPTRDHDDLPVLQLLRPNNNNNNNPCQVPYTHIQLLVHVKQYCGSQLKIIRIQGRAEHFASSESEPGRHLSLIWIRSIPVPRF